MTKNKMALSKPHPLDPDASFGIRPEPGQDPASTRQVMHVDKATSRAAGGSETGSFNLNLINRTVACARINADPNDPDTGREAAQTSEAVILAMRAFKPTDEVEGMLAAQAVMLHHLAMEAGRRAMSPKQPPEVASKLRKDAANAARGMADMVDALARHRGKGPQVIRVEKMMVADGGQAVVGNVTTGTPLPMSARRAIAQGERPAGALVIAADTGEPGGGEGA